MLKFVRSLVVRNINATIWSCQGFWAAVKSEAGMRQWGVVASIASVIACLIDLTGAERALVFAFTWNIVLMELANTAIETVVNRFSEDIHPLSKKAKDIGSAMVFFAIVMAIVVWGFILLG